MRGVASVELHRRHQGELVACLLVHALTLVHVGGVQRPTPAGRCQDAAGAIVVRLRGEIQLDRLPTWTWDVLGVAGVVLIVVGLALVYVPLAFIVPGSVMMAMAVHGARRAAAKLRDRR